MAEVAVLGKPSEMEPVGVVTLLELLSGHLLIYELNKYLLSTYSVPGTKRGPRDTSGSKKYTGSPFSPGAHSLVGEAFII